MKKFSELKTEKGYGPIDHVESMAGFGQNGWGPAWTFVLLARLRGWDVTEPLNNGFNYPIVYIWKRGPDDAEQEAILSGQ